MWPRNDDIVTHNAWCRQEALLVHEEPSKLQMVVMYHGNLWFDFHVAWTYMIPKAAWIVLLHLVSQIINENLVMEQHDQIPKQQ